MSQGESGTRRVGFGAEISSGLAALALVPYILALRMQILTGDVDIFLGIFALLSVAIGIPLFLLIALILLALSWKRRSGDRRIVALGCVAIVLLLALFVVGGHQLTTHGSLNWA
jgi:hypothetical protein